MIYCVVPEELAPELYDKLASYYEDDPNVEVIIDRRKGSRRHDGDDAPAQDGTHRRQVRDRRRPRVPGEFPQLDPE
jgi:hypothetical protein